MGRPSLGHDARNVPVTVKVTQREALALKTLGGSPARGLRRLIDQSVGTPRRHESTPRAAQPVPSVIRGGCRIHKNWSEPTEVLDRGHKTITKVCLDCGHISSTTRPA